jgi:hypothetical protein
VPELLRLARTLDTWRPELLEAFTATGKRRNSNGPTEAVNALIKKVKKVGHGFRNLDNYFRIRIRLRRGGVLRAHVPEAPVDENGDLRRPEDDVRPPAHARDNGPLDAVAKAGRVQGTTQGHLRPGVPSSLLLHPAADNG